jgi:hypothetical protein
MQPAIIVDEHFTFESRRVGREQSYGSEAPAASNNSDSKAASHVRFTVVNLCRIGAKSVQTKHESI